VAIQMAADFIGFLDCFALLAMTVSVGFDFRGHRGAAASCSRMRASMAARNNGLGPRFREDDCGAAMTAAKSQSFS
jgi:hypothetical protein